MWCPGIPRTWRNLRRTGDFPVLTFDTYGTLIDWETGIWEALQPLRSRLADPRAREESLAAFARAESACQEAAPGMLYADVLAATHRTLALCPQRGWTGDRLDRPPRRPRRRATAPPQEEVAPDYRFTSMAELVARHRAEGG